MRLRAIRAGIPSSAGRSAFDRRSLPPPEILPASARRRLNTNVVTDPNGTIFRGVDVRIPFQLTEANINVTAIVLTDRPGVEFLIQTPAGGMITPWSARGLGATFAVGTSLSYYRFTLHLALSATPA